MYRNLVILLIILVSSCTVQEETNTKTTFFDIKGFFEAEADRLTHKKSPIDKIVIQNNQTEIKKGLSVNWHDELALFISSDINKPAWIDSYELSEVKSRITYIAIDTNLRTRFVEIIKDNQGRAVFLKIKNVSRSMLYESSEELIYIPDSIYKINKIQNMRFLGNNKFQIEGLIVK